MGDTVLVDNLHKSVVVKDGVLLCQKHPLLRDENWISTDE